MRFLPTRIHGVLDYLTALLLIGSPWLLGFYTSGYETHVPVALGVITIVYSLFTDYELGVIRRLSMRTHLGLDLANGILLALSPWLFNFAGYVKLPHLFIGLMEIAVVMISQTHPPPKSAAPDSVLTGPGDTRRQR